MTRFLARRLLNYLVLLVLASFLTFALTSVTFSPLDSLLQRNPRPPQSVIDAKAAELGLDKPLPQRYAAWVEGAVHGDFGKTVGGQPVSQELWRRVGASLRLVGIGSVLGALIGVVVGAWGAVRQYRLSDRVITALSLLVLSAPTFVIANLLILAALGVNSVLGIQLFQYTGETSPYVEGGWAAFVDRLAHLALPTLTLALAAIAGYSRYQRNAMLDVLGQDFIRTARAKGLSRRRVLWDHVVPNALVPILTILGLQFTFLIAGAVLVENVFNLPGLGRLAYQALTQRDVIVMQDVVLFFAALVIVMNFVVDLSYLAIDPRLREKGAA